MGKKRRMFVKGAWLYNGLEKELTEEEFIEKAGGLEKLEKFSGFPFVSLVLDNTKDPLLVGHITSDTIAINMRSHGHRRWQTMEWK